MRNKLEIRFKGYPEDWKSYMLGNIGDTYTGLSGKTKNDFGHGKAKYVTYMNVFKNTISKPFMVDSLEIDKKQNQIKYGDVFFTTSSETPSEVGMSSVWLNDVDNTYLNSFCFGYRLNGSVKLNEKFLAYILRSPNVRKDFSLLAQGISRYNISKNKAMDIKLAIPINENEQCKIGGFLYNVDSLLEQKKNELEKTKQLKRSMLTKMFPQGDSKVPEIRVKKYNADWESFILGDNINFIVDNRGKNPPYYCSRGIPVIDNYMIGRDCYPNLKSANRFVDEFLYNSFIRKHCKEDDILVTLVGNGIGNLSLFPKEKSVIIQNTLGLRFDNDDKKFMYYLLLSNTKQIKDIDRGMAQPSIRQDELLSLEMKRPKLEEQKEIGLFFTNIDNLIRNQEKEITNLEHLKSTLMNKMFAWEEVCHLMMN